MKVRTFLNLMIKNAAYKNLYTAAIAALRMGGFWSKCVYGKIKRTRSKCTKHSAWKLDKAPVTQEAERRK